VPRQIVTKSAAVGATSCKLTAVRDEDAPSIFAQMWDGIFVAVPPNVHDGEIRNVVVVDAWSVHRTGGKG
jgi:hypothetical protein